MKHRILALAAALLSVHMALSAQERFEAKVQADLVSHYMWRGTDKGHISIQPKGSIAWQGISLSAFGNTGLDKEDAKELNLNFNLQRWGINLGVTDYWKTGVDYADRYFYFEENKSPHLLEGNAGFSCRYFSLQGYTIFWGNDFKLNGDRAYSTYIELSIPFYLGGLDWDLRAGMTPMESAGMRVQTAGPNGTTITSSQYTYGEKLTCNMASLRATKNMELGDMNIPIFAEIHTNPYLQKATMLVGVSFIPF